MQIWQRNETFCQSKYDNDHITDNWNWSHFTSEQNVVAGIFICQLFVHNFAEKVSFLAYNTKTA